MSRRLQSAADELAAYRTRRDQEQPDLFTTIQAVTDVPTCRFCHTPYRDATGCTPPEAQYTIPHDVDERCRDCGVQPGRQHHPDCCVAQCGGGQSLFCDCAQCAPVNDRLYADWQMRAHPVWKELDA